MKTTWILLFFGVCIVAGCASTPPIVDISPEPVPLDSLPQEPVPVTIPLVVPSGVDSSFARLADSLAILSFVSLELEDQASVHRDSGSKLLEDATASWTGAEADSTEAARARDRQSELLSNAQSELEAALTANPFNAQARLLLAQLHHMRATRLKDQDDLSEAISQFEIMTVQEKGEHFLFYQLGVAYREAERWRDAEDAFSKAERVLQSVGKLTPGASLTAADSSVWYEYLFSQGDAQARQNRSRDALESFESARSVASTVAELNQLDGYVMFIDWDGGNIGASEMRDSLLAVPSGADLDALSEGWSVLLSRLQTQPARDEIDWRIAILDTRRNLPDQAAERLRRLYGRIDVVVQPLDSLQTQYIEDYGIVCFNRGREFEDLLDRRTALKYFLQASEISWSQQANAYLQVVGLLQNNVDMAIRFARLGLEASPSTGVRNNLFEWLVTLNGRAGLINEAREYRRLLDAAISEINNTSE